MRVATSEWQPAESGALRAPLKPYGKEGDPLAPGTSTCAEPRSALDEQLLWGLVRVVQAQCVRGDTQPVRRCLVDVGPLQPADQLQRVHPGGSEQLRVGVRF